MGRDKNEVRKYTKPKSLFDEPVTGNGEPYDWGSEDPGRLLRLIEMVTGRGGAIRFGYSRDGHAGSIGIYYGEARDTLWIRPSGNSEDTFARIEEKFAALPNTHGVSPE
jgi:hypothetical protein